MSLRFLWALLAVVALLRLILLPMYPLMDTSEARYAEMARKMVELNDWITPMFDYGVPFWGKPPLSFWGQALSIKLFGANEFSVRFPSFIFHLLSCWVIIRWAKQEVGLRQGIFAAIMYSSCIIGFVAAGAVLTDPGLSFSVLLAAYGFWRGIIYQSTVASLFGFLGLALGVLAKGPLVLVIFGVPAFMWVAYGSYWRQFLALPWVRGGLLFFAISAPWYVLAEMKTPGFFEYFFVGEHWKRYVVSGWNGDLYGNAHARQIGTIWIYFIAAAFPWILLIPLGRRASSLEMKKSLLSYLLAFVFFLPVFFTFSRNILWTYVLPAMPFVAIGLSCYLFQSINTRVRRILVLSSALFIPLVLLGAITEGSAFAKWKNQKRVIAEWELDRQGQESIYYVGNRVYSSEFYSHGLSKVVDENNLDSITEPTYYLALVKLSKDKLVKIQQECEPRAALDGTRLYRCVNDD